MRRFILPAILITFVGCSSTHKLNVVRLADWSGAGDDGEFNRLVKTIYDEFEAANPGIDLQVEGTPDMQAYVTKTLLGHVAGTAPDVMRLDASSAAVFINNGVLLDLSEYINNDPSFSLDDYFPNVVDITRREKAVYGLPMGFTPMVLYYNKRLFDESGVPYPSNHWTYADFLDAAKKLTHDDQYGFDFSNWMAMWILFLWNNGGDVLSPDGTRASGYFDSPQSVEAVQFVSDLVRVHKVAPTLSQSAALGVDLFANGRTAMKITGHWSIIGFQASKEMSIEDLGVAPIPTNLPKSVTVMYESGLAIMKNCKNPDLAWALIKHLLSYDVQSRYNASGIELCARRDVAGEAALLPLSPLGFAGSELGQPSSDPRKRGQGVRGTIANGSFDVAQDDVLNFQIERVVPPRLEQAFVGIVPSCRPPWGARVERYNLIEPIGEKMMDRVLNQSIPVKQALQDAAREIDRELTKE